MNIAANFMDIQMSARRSCRTKTFARRLLMTPSSERVVVACHSKKAAVSLQKDLDRERDILEGLGVHVPEATLVPHTAMPSGLLGVSCGLMVFDDPAVPEGICDLAREEN